MGKKENDNERIATYVNQITRATSSVEEITRAIFAVPIGKLAKISNLSESLIKNHERKDQIKLFESLLIKCNAHPDSQNKEIILLKIQTLNQNALIIIESYIDTARLEVREKNISHALDLLEQSNLLEHIHNPEIKNTADSIIQDTLEEFAKNRLDNSLQKSFEFSEKSVKLRQEKLPTNHFSTIEALLTTAKIGMSIEDDAIKAQSIQYAKLAYNMAITVEKFKLTSTSLQIQALIFKSLGDMELSKYLRTQADKLLLKEIDKRDTSNQIILHGDIDEKRLLIKKDIQELILDPIKEAAANGKWVRETITGNNGVSGYLGDFLKTHLKDAEDMEVALELCFEAINLGIMSADKQNPLCAAIFAQEYPKTIANILKKHPEYFVDAFILKTSMPNAAKYSKKLLGYELDENKEYNTYFEEAIIPFLTEREQLKTQIFDPIKDIIKDGSWNEQIKTQLLNLVSEEYLTSTPIIALPGFGGSILGQNLAENKDVINIIQIIAFRTLLETIIEEKSDNYAPITAFIKAYPEIVTRATKDHSEYLQDNKMLTDVCDQALASIPDNTEDTTEVAGDIDDVPS